MRAHDDAAAGNGYPTAPAICGHDPVTTSPRLRSGSRLGCTRSDFWSSVEHYDKVNTKKKNTMLMDEITKTYDFGSSFLLRSSLSGNTEKAKRQTLPSCMQLNKNITT